VDDAGIAALVLEGLQALNLMSDAGAYVVPPAEATVFRGPWAMWRDMPLT
jgi:hypothetical protein